MIKFSFNYKDVNVSEDINEKHCLNWFSINNKECKRRGHPDMAAEGSVFRLAIWVKI